MAKEDRLFEVLRLAKTLAQEFKVLTGKPLGITGEVAEYEAARILGLTLTAARNAGFDATEKRKGRTIHLQIKGRCLPKNCKPGQRLGSIDIDKNFDVVLLVLLDESFNATAIYEADRAAVIAAINAPGSKARNDRRALGIGKFKRIGRLRWLREN